MSDTSRPREGFEEDDLVAAEYALGVLDPEARRSFERRMRRDDALLRRVEDWERRLSPMLTAIEPVEAPPAVWAGVEADLDRVVRFRSPAASAEGLVSHLWKWFGLGSFGLLAASLAALFVVMQPRPAAPPLAALIAPEGGAALYAAVIDPRSRRATLIPIAVGADPAHSHELWMIAPNAPPRSLGVLSPGGPVQVVVTPDMLAGGTGLAISREPVGGSPTGQPTGPVVGTGELQRI